MTQPPDSAPRPPRSPAALALLALAGAALFVLFAALGAWQLERRAWKLQLIERVGQRLHASPTALPPRSQWPQVDAASHEYQPVRAQGRWMPARTVLTQATTGLGAGWWVLTPLALHGGGQVLVNRGFIPDALRARWAAQDPIATAPDVRAELAGLLRISEPGGGFLRRNAPEQGRWHSRDVAAIAQAQGLADAAPFFIDQGLPGVRPAAPEAPRHGIDAWPRAGLTVVRFHNSHLVYVFTWWGLAALVAGAAVLVTRHERRVRAAHRDRPLP